MATLTKHTLSRGYSGRGVNINPTAIASSVPIHEAGNLMANHDEVWAYASNFHTAPVDLTIIWGLSGDGADLALAGLGNATKTVMTLAANTRTTVINGRILQNGLSACAFAATTAVINIDGYVNRITA